MPVDIINEEPLVEQATDPDNPVEEGAYFIDEEGPFIIEEVHEELLTVIRRASSYRS